MKQLYNVSVLLSFLFFSACSKDFLKSYDRRIIGAWYITGVNRVGLGGNTDQVSFKDGRITFNEDGSLTYINPSGAVYQGHWDIVKKTIGDDTQRSLQLTAVDFASQHVLGEYYDDMNFVSADHFKASIASNFHTYVTHFRR